MTHQRPLQKKYVAINRQTGFGRVSSLPERKKGINPQESKS
jgi:hypothetical protein